MKRYLTFAGRVIIAHVVTYSIVGSISYQLLTKELYEGANPVFATFLRTQAEPELWQSVMMWLFQAQILRGLLISAVLYPFIDTLNGWSFPKRWLSLAALYIVLGYWAAMPAAPGTIEGAVYMRPTITPEAHLRVQPEAIVQGIILGAWIAWWMTRLPCRVAPQEAVTAPVLPKQARIGHVQERIKFLNPWLPRAAAGILILILCWTALLFFSNAWNALTFPYPLDYGEGQVLDQVVKLSRLQNIYRSDVTTPQYTLAYYPPLFMLVQIPFVWLCGPAFWYGRAVSLLSVMAAAVFIALTIHVITQDKIAAAVSGLALLAMPCIVEFSALFRIDAFALALSWAGLFVVVRRPHQRNSLVITAVLLTAAIYTRQTYALVAPFAAFVWLLSHRPQRAAFVLASIVGGLSLGLFLILNTLTGGGFYFNIVTANINEFRLYQLTNQMISLVMKLPFFVLTSGAVLLVCAWARTQSHWLVGSLLVGGWLSIWTVGKVGAHVNYLFELSAALCLAAGVLIAWQHKRPWLRIVLMLLLAFQIYSLNEFLQGNSYFNSRITRRAEIDRLRQIVHAAEGSVLADEYMGLLSLDGRMPYIEPHGMARLAAQGLWNPSTLIEAIKEKEFAAILIYAPLEYPMLAHDRWTREARYQINLSYKPAFRLADTMVYLPAQNMPTDSEALSSSPKLVRLLDKNTGWVTSMAFAPDGNTLALGTPDGAVQLWRMSDWTLLRTWREHLGSVESVAFSSNGAFLASGAQDSLTRLWRVADGILARVLEGRSATVLDVGFSPDGAMLASGTLGGAIRLWRVNDGTPLSMSQEDMGSVESIAFSPDGAILASGSADSMVRLWRVADGTLVRTLEGHRASVLGISFSPDGTLLASASDDETVQLWRVTDGASLGTLKGHIGWVRSLAFTSDGSILASGGQDGTVRLWRMNDQTLLHTLNGYTDSVEGMAFVQGGTTLVWGTTDSTIWQWETDLGRP